MKKIVLKIDGMTCSACSSGLEKYLNKQEHIINANVNLVFSIATIEYEKLSIKEIENYIKQAGFRSRGEFKGIEDKDSKQTEKIHLLISTILIIFLMYITMSHMLNIKQIELISRNNPINYSITILIITMIFILYGFDIIKSGFKNLFHKMPNMDTLVTFSITSSFLYSLYGIIKIFVGNPSYINNLYFESTCMIIYFIKLGRYIENISKDKTKDAIKKLVQITPKNAIIKENNSERKISIDEVKLDNILICRSGEKIAVDGIVIEGKTYVDESFITGESKPVLKEKNSKVIAGSICYDGYIEYQAKKIGRESTISGIVKLVVEATNTKNKIQRLSDKISSIFVPTVIIIAILTFIIQLLINIPFKDSLNHFITILVVACPCTIGLAVPLVIVVSNGLCAKKGLYIRNSEILESAKNIDTIIFDKTGTLTYGKLKIFKTYNYSKYNDKELLDIVSSIENKSSHPIATAFTSNKMKNIKNYKTINGIGISGEINNKKYYLGNDKILSKLKIKSDYKKDYNYLVNNGCSIIYVIEDNQIIGLIGVKDILRKNIKNLIQDFEKNNIEVIMLTGDNEITAKIIAKELGIENVIANVLPIEKSTHIKKLINKNKKVIMVGDGINDAPALINSTIGISINDGTDVAMDSADVILMNNNLNNILDLIKISKSSSKIINQNLFWAFFYNLCMILIAMGLLEPFGIKMNPMFGSIAMTISSITVVLNSLRLRRIK